MIGQFSDVHPDIEKKFIDAGYWTDETLNTWLQQHANNSPNKVAIVHPSGSLTYQDLKTNVDRLTNGLLSLGLKKGDVIAVQLPNTLELILSYLAITAFGGVMQTIHMPYRDADIEFLLGHSKARAVICLPAFKDFPTADVMLSTQLNLTSLEFIITTGDNPPAGTQSLNNLFIDGIPEIPSPPIGKDPFILLYTSGTTSNPKGVPLTYHTMISSARLCAPEFKMNSADVIISAAPFSHLYGIYSFHVALCVGATNVLLPAFTPPDLAKLIEATKVTTVFLGPPHAAAMINAGLMDAHDFSSVRFTVFSGVACPPPLMAAYIDKIPGTHVGQLWGMTETAGGTYCRYEDPNEVALTSSGRAAPGNEVRIVDPETASILPANTEGELQITGCSVFSGYLDNPEANASAFTKDGWFRSGDIAKIDENGNMTITGRSKDVINRGGVKFNPADIEDLITGHPAVELAAIVPMPDPVLGEKACCFISLKPDAAITLEEICILLDDHKIAKNKWPERLETIEEMPLTPTRKIIKGKLIEKL